MVASRTTLRVFCVIALLGAVLACACAVARIDRGEYLRALGDIAFAAMFTWIAGERWPLP